MNNRIEKLIQFITSTRIEDCAEQLQDHAKKCFLDLAMVTACGTRNPSTKLFSDYAETMYPGEDATILHDGKKASLIGATMANASAANALDMDDGYSMTMGHPGAGIVAGILAAAEKRDCSYGDFLSALLVGYEVAMRQGLALQKYYDFYHSTGSYAGYGTAAAVAKLFKLNEKQISNALGIADYYGPLVPCMRTVNEPSLNKDGIYMGAKLGVEAVLLAQNGIDGKAHILGENQFGEFTASLGDKWYIYDLYFKFFSCCRWAQGALTAIKQLREGSTINPNDIECINVYSYGASGELYTGVPENEMEAQYNMLFPIAVYLVHGDFGPIQSSIDIDTSKLVTNLMEKINYQRDADYENAFPAKRYTRVEIVLKNGNALRSDAVEPIGEPTSNVSMNDIIEKGMKINSLYCDPADVKVAIDSILNSQYDTKFSEVYEDIKRIARAR